MAEIPVIDFSNLEQGSSWEHVRSQVRKALEEDGLLEAKFDQSPLQIRKSTFEKVREVLDLPIEVKQRNNFKSTDRGYLAKKPGDPLYESLGIDHSISHQSVESFTKRMWPQGNLNFSETVKSYADKISELDNTVRRMILESYGLDNYIDEHMNSTEFSLRFNKYDGIKIDNKEIGMRSHQDRNFLTIIQQEVAGGLEVLTKDGEWVALQCSLDSYIVVVGQSLRAFTNGKLHAPHHRVVVSGSDPRFSIALFCNPLQHIIVKPADEMVDDENPLRFKPFQYSQISNFLFIDRGSNSDDLLKDLFGI